MKSNIILILDYGSQYTHRIRSLSLKTIICDHPIWWTPLCHLLEYVDKNGIFVLGICYGLQLIVQKLGGQVVIGEKQEYGKMVIQVKDGGLPKIYVDSFFDTFAHDLEQKLFLSELKGVTDPEKKRKIIGKEFISIFDTFAHDLEQKLGRKPTYLVQGTLYPDVIESCPPSGSGKTHSHTIKSHHNVGGLPKDMKLKLIEPLKLLFKDEVCELGKILDVPVSFHPFPGPGLAVRIPGDVTQGNALDILRQVDEIFIQAIKDAGIYDEIWQAFAVFLPVKTTGVQGDQRTHSNAVALRAVTSQDGMTADWYYFEHKFLDDVSRKICNSVRGVNRVCLDITSKPPSTIEWE